MVSKNNRVKRMEEAAERQSHFSIRKLTIGAASVLLGTTLWMGTHADVAKADNAEDNNGAHAEQASPNEMPEINSDTQVVAEVTSSNENTDIKAQAENSVKSQVQAPVAQEVEKSAATNLVPSDSINNKKAENSVTPASAETKKQVTVEQKADKASEDLTKANDSVASKDKSVDLDNLDLSKAGLEGQLATDKTLSAKNVLDLSKKANAANVSSDNQKVSDEEAKRLKALFGASFIQTNDQTVKTVGNSYELNAALNDSSVKTINLQGNSFDVNNVSINRDVTIDGGRSGATLNFGNSTISMNNGLLGFFGGNPIHLTLANVTINSYNAGGAITSENDNNVITFNNVTNNQNSLFNGKGQVHIQGKVTTNVNDNSQVGDEALQGFADAKNTGAGTNLYGTNSSTTVQRANSAIIDNINKRKVPNIYASNLYIDDNATLNVNRTATGDGIVLRDGARTEGNTRNITSTVANRGKLTVGNNAVLNINLKDSQMSGEQLKATERFGIDNLNAGVRVNTSGSFLTGKNAIVNIKSGHGRAIVFSENNVNLNPKVWNNYVYRGQESDGGYTVGALGTSKYTDFVRQNSGIKNEFKLGNGTKMNVMGREAFMLGNNSVFDSGENSNVLVHNYGHGNAIDMGSADGDHPDNDENHSGQLIVGTGSTVQFFSDGKDTTNGNANYGMNNYVSMGGGGKIKVLKDATLRVILTNRGFSKWNDDININSRDPELNPGLYVGNNAVLDVQSDAEQGNAELIAIPLSASKDINFILDNVKYVNLQKTARTSATTLAPADPDLNKAAAHAHVPNSKAGYGNLIIMNTGRDGKGHLKAFGNLAAFKWDNENLSSNGLDFDPNQSVSANYNRFEHSANQTWSNMYGFDMPYQMFTNTRNSGEVWVDPNGSTAGTNVNSNHGAGFADFVKGFSPYMSQRLVVIGHSIQPVFNQRTVHYVVQDVDDNGNPIETDPTQMREIANPFVQAAEGNNAQSQLLYKDNATDQLIRVERNSDGTPRLDSEGNVIPVRDSNGNYESDGNRVNKWNSKDNSIESSNGNTYFKSYEGPQTITGRDGNGHTIESLDGSHYKLATDAQLATITSNRNQVVYGGRVANSKNFANTTDDFKNSNFYNTYKDGNLYIVYRAVQEKATLKIVDDTTGETLNTYTAGGNDNTAINFGTDPSTAVSDHLKNGYKFVNVHDDNNNVDLSTTSYDAAKFGNFDEDPNTDQSFTVHLVHDVIPVTPDTPPTDVPKTPDGKQLVDPSKLSKDVTLEVTYKNSDGTAFTGKTPSNAKQTLSFTGKAYVDKVTGQLVNAKEDGDNLVVDKGNTATPSVKWTPKDSSFTKVISPNETGYHVSSVSDHADGNDVAAISGITKDSENVAITVTYDKDVAKQGSINVKFHDTTNDVDIPGYGNNSGTQDVGTSFTYNPNDDIKTLEGKGYVLDGPVPTIPTSITEGTQNFVINMKHGVKPVNPNNPGDKYKKDDLQKTVTRNIKYVDQQGNTVAPDHNDTFTFTAQGNEDEVTHNLVNLNPDGSIKDQNGQLTWNAADHSFDKVISPSIDGKHVVNVTPSAQADGNDVKSVTVNHDSDNINVVVTYAPNGNEVRDAKDVPAKQTTKFVDENGKELAKAVVQNSNFHYSGDTYDKVTDKKISDGSWNEESHKFNTVNAPVIDGYVAEAKTADGLTATIAKPDVENQIVYHKIGKIIPIDKITNEPIPGADQPQYKNDPTDPTKVISNEPIPKVDNYTPVDPSPITPEDPTKDTKVPYQRAVEGSVKYIDDTTNKTLATDSLKGFAGDKINYTTADKIANYEKQGYELVSNSFKDGNETYAEKGNNFEVHLKHGLTPVTPEDPKGVDPKQLKKPVKETVHYEGAGDKTPKDVVQDATWTRNLTQDKVTGKLVPNGEYDTEWTPSKENYDEVKSPEVKGFHPDKETVPTTKVTQDNINVTVKYSPNGTEVKDQKDVPASQTTKFVDENGNELAKSVVQNSNFHFSGNTYDKVTGEKTKDGSWNEESHKFNSVNAPVIQGYVAEAKTADGLTATVDNPDVHNEIVYHKIGKIIPVDNITKQPIPNAEQPQYKNDQNDPTKVVPNEPIPEVTDYLPVHPGQQVTPEDPTKDTEVPYKQIVRGTVKYIDDTTEGTLKTDKIQGFIGDKIDYATAGIIKGFEDNGYKLVKNNFKDGDETYARTGNNFEVHLVHTYSPVTPENPHGVDPKELTKDVKETIKYVGAGDKTPKDNVQTSQWTRQFTWDNVDKKIVEHGELDKDWSITPGQKTNYDEVKSPEIEGYHPDKVTVPSTKVTQKDIEVIVTYAPNGQEVRDTKDVPATQTTKFVDENGKELAQSVVQNSNFHFSGNTYDKFNNQKIKSGSWNEESHKFNSVDAPVINGYVAEAKTADGLTATVDKPNVENQIVYHKIGKIIPVDPNHNPIPDAPTPEYKNDPNDPTKVTSNEPTPKVPGWTTNTPDVTPNDPTKDTQVVYKQEANGTVKYIDDTAKTTLDSDNLPSGYVGDKINYTTADKIADYEKKGFKLVSNSFKDGNETYAKTGNNFEVHFVHNLVPVTPDTPHGVDPSLVQKDVKETVKYVGAGEKTPKDVVQTSKWTRTLTMDQVTGQLIPKGKLDTAWAIAPGEKTNYDEVKSPVIEGYHANKTTIPATKVTQENITEIVTYAPNDQEVRDTKDVPATQTTKFIDDNGNQLVDPVIQHSNFHYSGNTYDKETGKEVAKGSWDAESHKFDSVNAPVINGYVAEAKTADGLTATIDNPDVTNQIVYHKIGKIIPVDPNHDPIPDAPTPEYKNDPKDPTKVVPNEPIPEVDGYTPVDPTPITPQDPTKNTQVVYNQVVEGTVTYYDDTTGQTLGNIDSIKGYVGDKINYSTQGRIDNYESKGYKLVSDGFTTSDQIFKKAHNNFEVHLKHDTETITPKTPDPKHGYTTDSLTKTGTQTVHYVGAGAKTPADDVQHITLEHTLVIDKVDGHVIVDNGWKLTTPKYSAVFTPDIEGYTAQAPYTFSAGGEEFTYDSATGNPTNGSQMNPYYTVVYTPVAKDQKAKVQYIDLDENDKLIDQSPELIGKAGETIKYSTADKIKELTNKGYELANDGFPAGTAFDNVDGNEQIFKVTFHHGHQPVNPKNPGKPGEPINPDDPEGSVFPPDSDKVTKSITRTIHYEGAGTTTPSDIKQTVNFTANGELDKVTGEWTTPLTWSGDQTVEGAKTPVVKGYYVTGVDKDSKDGVNVDSATIKHDGSDYTVTVHYAPVGKIIPVDPSGKPIPKVPNPPYENDPSDPTKVIPNEPVPDIPGYVPSVPTVTPQDPGKNTEVVYNPILDQNAVVNYIDSDDNNSVITTSGNLSGKSGSVINYSTASTIKQLQDKGYVLVNNGFDPNGQAPSFDNDDNTTQTYQVILKHGTTPVTPENPGKPGEPINPNDPEGPKFPDGTDKDSLVKVGTQTVRYEGAGNQTPGVNTTTVKFEHTMVVDNVTGKIITDNGWTPSSRTYTSVVTPNIPGYTPDMVVAGGDTVNVTDNNINREYTVHYTKNPVAVQGKVTYIDDTTGKDLDADNFSGNVGEKINYTTADKISNYESQGYELVSNSFKDGQEVFAESGNNFEVHLKHGTKDVTPKNPDPEHGFTHDSLIKTGTQTVIYKGAGNSTPTSNTTTVEFDHTLVIDKVTGKVVTDNGWAPSSQTYTTVTTPTVSGYTPDKTVVGGETVTINPQTGEGKIDKTYVVTYTKNPEPIKDQNAVVNYVDSDEGNKQIATSGNLVGKPDTVINYSTAKTIEDLKNKGYELVYDGFPSGATFDNDDRTTQTYTVVLKHGHTTVTPKNPGKPGEPINPDLPEGPKYPNGTDINNLLRQGTQTIHYTGAGNSTPQDNVESFDFTRNITFDNVTGKIIDGGTWNVASHKFDTVTTPIVNGYHADQIMAGGQTVTPDDLTKTITVNYTPNGKIIPVDPSGKPIPNAPTPQYPTDPKDPTDVTPNEPTPIVPGYTTTTKTVTPNDPGKDTEVVYTKIENDQNATIRYIDEDNNNSVIKSDNVTGKPGTSIDYSTAATIEDLQNQGYELVSDGFTGKNAKFDNDDNSTQVFDVVLKHGHTTITPKNPGKPGEPINPNNPEGPKWPNGTDSSSLIKTGTQTVHYEGAGELTPKDSVTTVEFDHSITFDNVTGKQVSDNGWTPSSQTYITVTTPSVPGYTANVQVVGGDTVHAGDPNLDRSYTVTYTKNTPDKPDTPQPTTPAPVNPETPATPENPTTPNQPETVTPHGEDVPEDSEETVRPHATAVHKRVNAPVHAAKVATVKKEVQPQLPQTGDDEEADILAAIAGGAAVTMSMIGLAGLKRRKH